jgi:hypothetical protein
MRKTAGLAMARSREMRDRIGHQFHNKSQANATDCAAMHTEKFALPHTILMT